MKKTKTQSQPLKVGCWLSFQNDDTDTNVLKWAQSRVRHCNLKVVQFFSQLFQVFPIFCPTSFLEEKIRNVFQSYDTNTNVIHLCFFYFSVQYWPQTTYRVSWCRCAGWKMLGSTFSSPSAFSSFSDSSSAADASFVFGMFKLYENIHIICNVKIGNINIHEIKINSK